jgi:hypothetical protein
MPRDYAITKTIERGGSITEATALFPANSRRVFLQINVIGNGVLYCSIGPIPIAHAGSGIYIDDTHPLCIQMPVVGDVWVVPDDSSAAVVYSAAEGLS